MYAQIVARHVQYHYKKKSKHHALNEIRTRDSSVRETQYCELLEPAVIEIACCLCYTSIQMRKYT
jgi:hypothetical protein